MKKNNFLNRKDVLIKYCFVALRDHFASQQNLNSWFSEIKSDEEKDKFLKVASYYAALVKNGDWHVNLPDSEPVVEYLTNTYKFIAIFSLIESLMESKYVNFYGYLKRKKTVGSFPLEMKDLDNLYNRYNEKYGAIRHCISFFRNLPPERQSSLVSKLQVSNGNTEPSIENFAKHLYRLRSNFVHEAELVHSVSDTPHLTLKGKKGVLCFLTISDAMQFFEEGLLARFQVTETQQRHRKGSEQAPEISTLTDPSW